MTYTRKRTVSRSLRCDTTNKGRMCHRPSRISRAKCLTRYIHISCQRSGHHQALSINPLYLTYPSRLLSASRCSISVQSHTKLKKYRTMIPEISYSTFEALSNHWSATPKLYYLTVSAVRISSSYNSSFKRRIWGILRLIPSSFSRVVSSQAVLKKACGLSSTADQIVSNSIVVLCGRIKSAWVNQRSVYLNRLNHHTGSDVIIGPEFCQKGYIWPYQGSNWAGLAWGSSGWWWWLYSYPGISW